MLKDFLNGVSIVDQLLDGGHQLFLHCLTLLVLDEEDNLKGDKSSKKQNIETYETDKG